MIVKIKDLINWYRFATDWKNKFVMIKGKKHYLITFIHGIAYVYVANKVEIDGFKEDLLSECIELQEVEGL